jgi:hypothetical protein
MRKTILFIVLGVLLLATLACGGGGGATATQVPPTREPTQVPPTEEATEAPPTEEATEAPPGTFQLQVVNESNSTVCYVYISPSDSNSWGDDWLGTETISSGEEYVFEVEPGTYDLKADDCDNVELATEEGVEFNEDKVWTLSDTGDGGDTGGETIEQWASSATASSSYTQFGEDRWSPDQTTGEPDTAECGDYDTAWASETSTGEDWLEVTFDTPVDPTEINIYETYNPSAVVKVEVRDENGEYHTVWEGEPELMDECPYVNNFYSESGLGVKADTVRITLDQSVNPGWNEIDAVQLIGIP